MKGPIKISVIEWLFPGPSFCFQLIVCFEPGFTESGTFDEVSRFHFDRTFPRKHFKG